MYRQGPHSCEFCAECRSLRKRPMRLVSGRGFTPGPGLCAVRPLLSAGCSRQRRSGPANEGIRDWHSSGTVTTRQMVPALAIVVQHQRCSGPTKLPGRVPNIDRGEWLCRCFSASVHIRAMSVLPGALKQDYINWVAVAAHQNRRLK